MIIDFTIANFRSIKRPQTFSLYAEKPSGHLEQNVHQLTKSIGVLRVAGIYGANASGKSNVLLAFEALSYMAYGSGDLKDTDRIPCYEPYRLSQSNRKAPTSFEIEFVTRKAIRFLYKVEFDAERITKESLDFFPRGQKANLFTRGSDKDYRKVKFGGLYRGGKRRFSFFPNNSYLSKAGNDASSPEIIRSVFNFFRQDIFRLDVMQKVQMFDWKEDPERVAQVGAILSKFDTGISGLEFEEMDASADPRLHLPEKIPERLRALIIRDQRKIPLFIHESEDQRVERFTEDLESSGTMKLYHLIPLLCSTFEQGIVLILDELDNSFHPHIAEAIISLFNDPKTNWNGAQLIFCSHNINLMSPQLLRRDQIWFTEKINGSTALSSLDEFDKKILKSSSPYGKWYEEGRFGAIPRIDIGEVSELLRSAVDAEK